MSNLGGFFSNIYLPTCVHKTSLETIEIDTTKSIILHLNYFIAVIKLRGIFYSF
jgi:hypothetical protein